MKLKIHDTAMEPERASSGFYIDNFGNLLVRTFEHEWIDIFGTKGMTPHCVKPVTIEKEDGDQI